VFTNVNKVINWPAKWGQLLIGYHYNKSIFRFRIARQPRLSAPGPGIKPNDQVAAAAAKENYGGYCRQEDIGDPCQVNWIQYNDSFFGHNLIIHNSYKL